ncbi:hypothetical protein MHBO_002179 [Bonamia ostreae]|uniref:CSD domain-containing protein n=1 Tax=Bonamia ostreae TaxID=126728 RepID=A0ABV2AM95_9EUKA
MSDSRKNQVSKIKTNSDSDNNTFKRQIDKETAEKIDKSVEYEGDCSWYNESKGYGFITCSALPCDAWVHISNINSNDTADPANAKLHTGQHCAFQVQLKPCPGAEDSFRVSAVNVFPVLKDGSEEPPKSAKRLSGVCVRFNEHKKFGFVQCAEKGCERLFVHKDQIQGGKPLREGQKVTLELATFKGRTKAVNVIAEKFVEDPLSKDVRKGVVAIFYDDRAFGFVREEDCGETHFFHKENVIGRKDLVEFQEVKFKLRKKMFIKLLIL